MLYYFRLVTRFSPPDTPHGLATSYATVPRLICSVAAPPLPVTSAAGDETPVPSVGDETPDTSPLAEGFSKTIFM